MSWSAKYAWHLPLYRQAQIMLSPRRRDRTLDAGVLGRVCRRGIDAALSSAAPNSFWARPTVAVDETLAPVLDPGRGRTKKGYFWSIARDDRALGRHRSAGRHLYLCAGAQRRPCDEVAR